MTTIDARGMRAASPGTAPLRRRRWRFDRRWLGVVPAVVLLGALAFYPLVQLLRMSMSDVTSITLGDAWQFIGLGNWIASWDQGDTPLAIGNTVVFVLIVTVLGLLGGFVAAVALRRSGRLGGLLLGLMVFIWALPPVVNGSVWKFLLGDAGLINSIAHLVGLRSIPFLYDEHLALVSVALVNSWAIIPFNALVFRAAILGIPDELFEAAQIDGARPWQELRFVLLPAVRPSTLVLAVLTIVYAFRSFDFIYVMTYGGPGKATNTLPFLGYLQAFVRNNYGLGASTAVLAAVFVLVLAVVYARNVRREELEG